MKSYDRPHVPTLMPDFPPGFRDVLARTWIRIKDNQYICTESNEIRNWSLVDISRLCAIYKL